MNQKVLAIYTAPMAAGRMVYTTEVRAIAGQGLEGDRYALGKGAWQAKKDGKVRHVTLIEHEGNISGNRILRLMGHPGFLPGETRRNIVTVGVELNNLVDKEFTVCGVRMRGVELAHPCKRPSAIAKIPHFDIGYQDVGGLRAEILSDGLIYIDGHIVV